MSHLYMFAQCLPFCLLVTHLIINISDVGIIVIIMERSLQQPMYLLFCNLSVNDILGNTNILPQIMSDLVSTDRSISYVECVTQAFCNHTSATAAHTILMIGLTIHLKLCRSLIVNMYCNNASLFKLSCQDVTINNIYGLAFTVVLLTSSMGSIASLTYIDRIVTICVTRKNKELNSKALQTCTSHLVFYMIMLWTGFLSIILHRIQIGTSYRNLAVQGPRLLPALPVLSLHHCL
ncbi:olfactory receptor 52D1-like [Paramormyrops kingsleyae]|uniref:olfactory receptor 52D1-like n=1 Tax=Paramormyrops kingsleyae TaxID=1676925 RepID=UPI003B96E8C3